MPDASEALTVIILAGGEATRLPGKLYLDAGNVPLLVRVFRNLSPAYPAVISCKGPLPPEIGALIAAPAIVDAWTLRGPLAGLLSTMNGIATPYVFACAGDAPFIDAAFVALLAARREAGDEAVVPRRTVDGRTRIEPLAAVYDRAAFLREGLPVLESGEGALRLVIDRLRTRYVDLDDARPFTNVNTPGDYAALQGALA
jgi:molybdopterin-guanine dinucleotide biosynthesis protein A